MSASLPPQLPSCTPRPSREGAPAFLAPLLKSVLLVCLVTAAMWGVLALIAIPLSGSEALQALLADEDLHWLPGSLRWLLTPSATTTEADGLSVHTDNPDANVAQLANSIFSDYVLAFELTSILLVIAVVGTVLLARKRKGQRVVAP